MGSDPAMFTAYHDVIRPEFSSYLDHEIHAAAYRTFQPWMFPGVLQTRRYAEWCIQNLSTGGYGAEERKRQLKLRTARRDHMLRAGGPSIEAIIDESVLHRRAPVEDIAALNEVIDDQIQHLRDLAHLDTVSVRVLPLTSSLYPGNKGALVLLATPGHQLAYLERHPTSQLLTDPTHVGTLRSTYDRIRNNSVDINDFLTQS